MGNDFPLLAGVIYDGNLLVAGEASGHTELQLGLDLLRDSSQFILVQTDIGAIEGLEDHIACERGWLGRIAIQDELILGRAHVSVLRGLRILSILRLVCHLIDRLLDLRKVVKHDGVRPSEERIRYLDLKVLRIIATRLDTFPFRCSVSPWIGHLERAFLLPLLLVLLEDLIPRLLQFVIAVVEHLGELEWHFGVALAGEGVQDLGKLGLAYDRVLDLADLLVAEDDMRLVNTQFERQE